MADIPGTRVHLVYPANNDAIVHYLGDVCARCINQNLYFRKKLLYLPNSRQSLGASHLDRTKVTQGESA